MGIFGLQYLHLMKNSVADSADPFYNSLYACIASALGFDTMSTLNESGYVTECLMNRSCSHPVSCLPVQFSLLPASQLSQRHIVDYCVCVCVRALLKKWQRYWPILHVNSFTLPKCMQLLCFWLNCYVRSAEEYSSLRSVNATQDYEFDQDCLQQQSHCIISIQSRAQEIKKVCATHDVFFFPFLQCSSFYTDFGAVFASFSYLLLFISSVQLVSFFPFAL